MCLYDNMEAQVLPVLTSSIIKQINYDKSRQNIYKKNILKILGCFRLWFVIVLLLHPAYSVPLKRIAELQLTKSSNPNRSQLNRNTYSKSTHKSTHSTNTYTASKDSSISSSSTYSPVRNRLLINMDTTDLSDRSKRSPGGETTCGGDSPLDHEGSQGSWMEPCSNHNLMEVGSATRGELSLHIMKAIVEANSQVENFINHFSNEAFGVPWKDAIDHSGFMLDFLNTTSGIDLRSDTITFEDSLQEAYELMQRRAVGIEQVTLDQALYQSSCLSRFRHLERRIIGILCQLRHAMLSKNVLPRENVTKNIMPESTRSLESEQSRYIRDAVILREYIDSLHLLHSVFNNFSQK